MTTPFESNIDMVSANTDTQPIFQPGQIFQPIQGSNEQGFQPTESVQSFTPESFNNIAQQDVQHVMNSVLSNEHTVVPPINQQIQSTQPAQAASKSSKKTKEIKQEEPTQASVVPPIIQTPLPELEPGQSIIAQLTPGAFDSFIKVISLLDEKNIINIEKSKILQLINNNTAILQTNIQQLVGNKEIDLHILQPKLNIRLFKAIKDNNDVFIIDDPENKRFQLISGEVRVLLPKQIDEIKPEVNAPSFTTDELIGTYVNISKEERNKIFTLMSGTTSITLLIKDNQLKGYLIPERVEATFKQFSNEKISENNADLKLTSSAFLSIPSDGETIITLAKQDDNYWLMSKVNTAMVEIIVIESLQIAQTEELLF